MNVIHTLRAFPLLIVITLLLSNNSLGHAQSDISKGSIQQVVTCIQEVDCIKNIEAIDKWLVQCESGSKNYLSHLYSPISPISLSSLSPDRFPVSPSDDFVHPCFHPIVYFLHEFLISSPIASLSPISPITLSTDKLTSLFCNLYGHYFQERYDRRRSSPITPISPLSPEFFFLPISSSSKYIFLSHLHQKKCQSKFAPSFIKKILSHKAQKLMTFNSAREKFARIIARQISTLFVSEEILTTFTFYIKISLANSRISPFTSPPQIYLPSFAPIINFSFFDVPDRLNFSSCLIYVLSHHTIYSSPSIFDIFSGYDDCSRLERTNRQILTLIDDFITTNIATKRREIAVSLSLPPIIKIPSQILQGVHSTTFQTLYTENNADGDMIERGRREVGRAAERRGRKIFTEKFSFSFCKSQKSVRDTEKGREKGDTEETEKEREEKRRCSQARVEKERWDRMRQGEEVDGRNFAEDYNKFLMLVTRYYREKGFEDFLMNFWIDGTDEFNLLTWHQNLGTKDKELYPVSDWRLFAREFDAEISENLMRYKRERKHCFIVSKFEACLREMNISSKFRAIFEEIIPNASEIYEELINLMTGRDIKYRLIQSSLLGRQNHQEYSTYYHIRLGFASVRDEFFKSIAHEFLDAHPANDRPGEKEGDFSDANSRKLESAIVKSEFYYQQQEKLTLSPKKLGQIFTTMQRKIKSHFSSLENGYEILIVSSLLFDGEEEIKNLHDFINFLMIFFSREHIRKNFINQIITLSHISIKFFEECLGKVHQNFATRLLPLLQLERSQSPFSSRKNSSPLVLRSENDKSSEANTANASANTANTANNSSNNMSTANQSANFAILRPQKSHSSAIPGYTNTLSVGRSVSNVSANDANNPIGHNSSQRPILGIKKNHSADSNLPSSSLLSFPERVMERMNSLWDMMEGGYHLDISSIARKEEERERDREEGGEVEERKEDMREIGEEERREGGRGRHKDLRIEFERVDTFSFANNVGSAKNTPYFANDREHFAPIESDKSANVRLFSNPIQNANLANELHGPAEFDGTAEFAKVASDHIQLYRHGASGRYANTATKENINDLHQLMKLLGLIVREEIANVFCEPSKTYVEKDLSSPSKIRVVSSSQSITYKHSPKSLLSINYSPIIVPRKISGGMNSEDLANTSFQAFRLSLGRNNDAESQEQDQILIKNTGVSSYDYSFAHPPLPLSPILPNANIRLSSTVDVDENDDPSRLSVYTLSAVLSRLVVDANNRQSKAFEHSHLQFCVKYSDKIKKLPGDSDNRNNSIEEFIE